MAVDLSKLSPEQLYSVLYLLENSQYSLDDNLRSQLYQVKDKVVSTLPENYQNALINKGLSIADRVEQNINLTDEEAFKLVHSIVSSDVINKIPPNLYPDIAAMHSALKYKIAKAGKDPNEIIKDKNPFFKGLDVVFNILGVPAAAAAKVYQATESVLTGQKPETPVRIWGGGWGDVVQSNLLKDEDIQNILKKMASGVPLSEEEQKKYESFSNKRFWYGLAGDIILDPLNFVGGFVKSGAKGAASGITKGVKEVSSVGEKLEMIGNSLDKLNAVADLGKANKAIEALQDVAKTAKQFSAASELASVKYKEAYNYLSKLLSDDDKNKLLQIIGSGGEKEYGEALKYISKKYDDVMRRIDNNVVNTLETVKKKISALVPEKEVNVKKFVEQIDETKEILNKYSKQYDIDVNQYTKTLEELKQKYAQLKTASKIPPKELKAQKQNEQIVKAWKAFKSKTYDPNKEMYILDNFYDILDKIKANYGRLPKALKDKMPKDFIKIIDDIDQRYQKAVLRQSNENIYEVIGDLTGLYDSIEEAIGGDKIVKQIAKKTGSTKTILNKYKDTLDKFSNVFEEKVYEEAENLRQNFKEIFSRLQNVADNVANYKYADEQLLELRNKVKKAKEAVKSVDVKEMKNQILSNLADTGNAVVEQRKRKNIQAMLTNAIKSTNEFLDYLEGITKGTEAGKKIGIFNAIEQASKLYDKMYASFNKAVEGSKLLSDLQSVGKNIKAGLRRSFVSDNPKALDEMVKKAKSFKNYLEASQERFSAELKERMNALASLTEDTFRKFFADSKNLDISPVKQYLSDALKNPEELKYLQMTADQVRKLLDDDKTLKAIVETEIRKVLNDKKLGEKLANHFAFQVYEEGAVHGGLLAYRLEVSPILAPIFNQYLKSFFSNVGDMFRGLRFALLKENTKLYILDRLAGIDYQLPKEFEALKETFSDIQSINDVINYGSDVYQKVDDVNYALFDNQLEELLQNRLNNLIETLKPITVSDGLLSDFVKKSTRKEYVHRAALSDILEMNKVVSAGGGFNKKFTHQQERRLFRNKPQEVINVLAKVDEGFKKLYGDNIKEVYSSDIIDTMFKRYAYTIEGSFVSTIKRDFLNATHLYSKEIRHKDFVNASPIFGQDIYVHKDIAKYLEIITNPTKVDGFVKTTLDIYDWFHTKLRGLLTVYSIYGLRFSFFIRNFLGNVFNSLMAVKDKKAYFGSLKEVFGYYVNRGGLFPIFDVDFLRRIEELIENAKKAGVSGKQIMSLEKTLKKYDDMFKKLKIETTIGGTSYTIITKTGQMYRISDLIKHAQNEKLIGSGIGAEIVHEINKIYNMKSPNVNMLEKAIQQLDKLFIRGAKIGSGLNSFIEDISKMALFITKIKEGEKIKDAAQITKKFLFDYNDLTTFEKKTMKRVVLFYTWLRKNIALQLEQLVLNPMNISYRTSAKLIRNMNEREKEKFIDERFMTGLLSDSVIAKFKKDDKLKKATVFMAEGILPAFDAAELVNLYNNPQLWARKNLSPLFLGFLGMTFGIDISRGGEEFTRRRGIKVPFFDVLLENLYRTTPLYVWEKNIASSKRLNPISQKIFQLPTRDIMAIVASAAIGTPIVYEVDVSKVITRRDFVNKFTKDAVGLSSYIKRLNTMYNGSQYPKKDMQEVAQKTYELLAQWLEAYQRGVIAENSIATTEMKRVLKEFTKAHEKFFTNYLEGAKISDNNSAKK